ncbi:mitochondrial ribonuclease P catalytic subunit isoform X1 [Bombus huntii]|uniref:mitochondrial ribonuclease P catalytic subunit isoform X1 n=2 Tax=Bombus huntii TaxID=85661 RepID=UPI0021AA9C8E|nr:mitochondrial ribonuclease P catalytic subunit isoform X1 [Bombus huntii]
MFSYIRQTSVLRTIIRNVYISTIEQKVGKYWQYVVNNCENALTQPSTISKETWENVRKHIIESQCDPSTLDFVILDMFQHMNYPDAGISYYKFLIDNNYKPEIPVITKYLQLYSIKNGPISEPDKEYILGLYNNISKLYTSFNEQLSNAFIECLCKMDMWKEAIKIIKIHEENDKYLLRTGYTSLISYLFDHKQEELAYEYLMHSLQNSYGPYDSAYTTYLKYCLKEKDTFNMKIEKLFLMWNAYGIKPSQDIAFECMNACIECGWSVSQTVISRSRCQKCNEDISQQSLPDEDYERLLQATKKRLIFKELHYVTEPREIQSFINFINKNKPYDIIADGLNIMYVAKNGINKDLIYEIKRIFKSYEKQNKKVLIIGKAHMKKFIAKIGLQSVDCFYVKNSSNDDLFLLYAAFASRKNGRIISKDLMRQHIFALQDIELNALFKKWQLSHQFFIDVKKGFMQLNSLFPIDAIVQKQNNSWHIPYVANDKISRMRHTCTNDWLCFKMH